MVLDNVAAGLSRDEILASYSAGAQEAHQGVGLRSRGTAPQKVSGIGLSAGRGSIRAAMGFNTGREAGVAGQRPAPRPSPRLVHLHLRLGDLLQALAVADHIPRDRLVRCSV